MNISDYRQLLDTTGNSLYLNYAATAPVSKTTAARMTAEIERMTQPLGLHFYDTLNEIENTRRLLGELVNTNPKNLAFTLNTSMAISTLALSIVWKPGDVVLIPDNEFPSNYFPWLNLASRGVECKTFTPDSHVSIVEDLKKQNLDGVRLISISAVSYQTGRLYELDDFVVFCRENGILSCLDAIQAIGSTAFDLQRIDPDFMCSGAQKWIMGPVGCGLLYARPALLESLDVPYVGWTSHKFPEYMSLDSLEFPDEMTRFEPGLPNYLPAIGAGASLQQLNEVGWNAIYTAISEHSNYLRSSLKSAGFRLLADGDNQVAGITSFHLPDGTSSRIAGELYEKHRIKVTCRNGYVRVSPHFFNEQHELDRFLNCTESIFAKAASSYTQPTLEHPVVAEQGTAGKVLVLGATGNLGSRICRLLAEQGYPLYLLARDGDKLEELATQLQRVDSSVNVTSHVVDFAMADSVQASIQELSINGAGEFHALVNCCSECEADLFHQLPDDDLGRSLLVSVEVPGRFMHLFLSSLKSKQAHGVLNIVSSTGRCGSPLLSSYGASHAALWTLSETLGREWADTDVCITTYVAPAMHSPLQKLMGRTALRYFRISGAFAYAEPDAVARQALQAFWRREAVHIARPARIKLWTNALWPRFVDWRLRRVWRR